MDRAELLDKMRQSRLVAVVRSKTSEEALALADAAAESRIEFVEITFTVPNAVAVIERLGERSDLCVGAGTVLSEAQARQAIGAGAKFLVAPSLELNLIPICHQARIPFFPGAATPSEVLTAARAGADLVKIFPADLVGGPDFIRQMAGPFPEVRFMVSGGVGIDNVADYVRLGVTGICLGSAYLGSLFARGRSAFAEEIGKFRRLVADGQAAGKRHEEAATDTRV
jgi:2-dehydro-3-deoxyphosphogluconate aldolase/(4S)-4-hydroxy-2-oxoglutarate aldolase